MQTRKALLALSKGEKSYEDRSGDRLAEHSERYLAQYENTQNAILEKQAELEVSTPFLNTIRRKLAKVAESQDLDVPVIAKFDLYAGIGRIASRTLTDVGLKRLATHLERLWKNDNDGTLSYAQVNSLVKMYGDQFPRSKAANAIKAECTKSGMHKLPVAKLARIAGKINSQEDYDSVISNSGLATDRPDHVRSRAFIRGLIAAKFGADVNEEEAEQFDSTEARVASRLASLDKEADYNSAIKTLTDAGSSIRGLIKSLSVASADLIDSNLERQGQAVHDLTQQLEEFQDGLNEAMAASSIDGDPHGNIEAPSPTAPMPEDAPAAPAPAPMPPPDEEFPGYPGTEELEEPAGPASWKERQRGLGPAAPKKQKTPPGPKSDEELAGVKKKWYDPRSWGYKKVQSILRNIEAVKHELDDELRGRLEKFAKRIAQMAPPVDPNAPVDDDGSDELEQMMQDAEDGISGPGLDDDMGGGMGIAPPEADGMPVEDMGPADLIKEIEEVSQEVIQDAPPDVQDYVEHEKAEGHEGEPGTAEWGAEEIIDEGHSAAPPSDEWMAEEMEEMGGDMGVQAKRAADGKSIPLPKGKPKSQPKVTSYAKNVKEDGAKTLKASEVEEAILDGKRVTQAGMTIFVNDSDEVEIWNKGAGVACGIEHFDRAVTDFVSMVNKRIAAVNKRVASSKTPFTYKLERVAQVPCEMCGTAQTFRYTANKHDNYRCACGHEISAESFMSLEKVAQMQPTWQVTISYNGMDPGARKALKWKLSSILSNIGSHRVDDESSDMMVASIWNTNKEGIETLASRVKSMGGQVETRRIAQAGGPDMGDVPEAAPGDFTEGANEKWPDEEIRHRIQQMFEQEKIRDPDAMKLRLEEERAYGTDRFTLSESNAADQLIELVTGIPPKRARKLAQDSTPATNALPDMSIGELANAAFVNYKAQGMSMMEAMRAFLGDHKERLANVGSSADGEIMGALQANFTGEAAPAAGPAGAPGIPPAGPPQGGPPQAPGGPSEPMPPTVVASRAAQTKLKFEPKVNQQQDDQVSMKKDIIGPDSSTKAKMPLPGKPKAQHKPTQKMSPTKMDSDSSTKAKMPLPGKPKIRHLPKDQSGVKLPDPKLDGDLSLKDPFPVPSAGSKPSVKK